MKVAAITKFKNGELWEAMTEAGFTQRELAKRVRVNPAVISKICQMRIKPPLELAAQISTELLNAGVEFDVAKAFPEDFTPLAVREIVQVAEVRPATLLEFGRGQWALPLEEKEEWQLLRGLIDKLPTRDQQVIYLKAQGKNYIEIGQAVNLTNSRVQQIAERTIRKLRLQVKQVEHGIQDFERNCSRAKLRILESVQYPEDAGAKIGKHIGVAWLELLKQTAKDFDRKKLNPHRMNSWSEPYEIDRYPEKVCRSCQDELVDLAYAAGYAAQIWRVGL